MTGRLSTWSVALLVAASLLAAASLLVAPGTAVTAGAAGDGGAVASPGIAQADDVDPDEVRMRIDLAADGAAAWEIQFWVRLSTEEEIQAFEDLRADVADDPTVYTDRFADRIDATVASASNATGREMAADEYAVRTDRQSLAREYGVLTYTFRWTGFAATEGDALHAGDAIDGYNLDDGTRLTITWPDGYELSSVAPEPDDSRDRAVSWRGSTTDFRSGEPALVVSAGGAGLPGYALPAVVALGAAIAAIGSRRFRR